MSTIVSTWRSSTLAVVAGVLHAGEGVGMAADGVEFLGDLKGGPLAGPFENSCAR